MKRTQAGWAIGWLLGMVGFLPAQDAAKPALPPNPKAVVKREPAEPGDQQNKNSRPTKSTAAKKKTAAPDPNHPPETLDVSPETHAAVTELLSTVWQLEPADIPKRGGAAVTRASRKRAVNTNELDYAYGLVLLHHRLWDMAAATFRKMTRNSPDSPVGWIGLAQAQFCAGKWEAGVTAIEGAVKAAPGDALTIRAVSTIATFAKYKPPAKAKKNRLPELVNEFYPTLDESQKGVFKQAGQAAKDDLDRLPERRQELQKALDEIRQQITKAEADIKNLQQQRQTALTSLQTSTNQLASLQVQYANVNASYNRQIAGAAGNDGLVQQLIAARANALNSLSTQIANSRLTIQRAQRKLDELVKDEKDTEKQLATFKGNIKRREDEIEAILALPPALLNVENERERLLAGGAMTPKSLLPAGPAGKPPTLAADAPKVAAPNEAAKSAPPGKAEPKSSAAETPPTKDAEIDDERKANSLLRLADTYARNRNTAKRKELLQRIIEKYPQTEVAKKAQKILMELDKPDGETPTLP